MGRWSLFYIILCIPSENEIKCSLLLVSFCRALGNTNLWYKRKFQAHVCHGWLTVCRLRISCPWAMPKVSCPWRQAEVWVKTLKCQPHVHVAQADWHSQCGIHSGFILPQPYLLWRLWSQTFSRQHAAVRNRSGAMLREKQTIDIFVVARHLMKGEVTLQQLWKKVHTHQSTFMCTDQTVWKHWSKNNLALASLISTLCVSL